MRVANPNSSATAVGVRQRLTPTYGLRSAAESEGFSGAEIEQAIVAARYSIQTRSATLDTAGILTELRQTRPLTLIMAEKIEHCATGRANARSRPLERTDAWRDEFLAQNI